MKLEFSQLLRQADLKATPARMAVLGAFSSDCKPLSAEMIIKKIKAKAIDPVTVYRTLAVLEKAGLISRVDLRQDAVHYELALHHHHHIVCTLCGRTEEFEECSIEDTLDKAVKKSKHFKALTGHSFEAFWAVQYVHKEVNFRK